MDYFKYDSATAIRMTRRKNVRKLAIFYDILFFVILYVLMFLVFGEHFHRNALTTRGLFLHFALPFLLTLLARYLLKVYNQVLRYGNAGAFARLVLADILGAGIYFLIDLILPNGYKLHYLHLLLFVFINLYVCLLARLTYYYLFSIANNETFIGKISHRFLLRFALVNTSSQKIAETLSLQEWLHRSDTLSLDPINEIQRIARQFQIHGEIVTIKRLNDGYINRTYRIETLSKNNHTHWYTLQRINTNVFPNVDALMENYEQVTNHLHENFLLPGRTERGSVQILKLTRDGKTYLRDDSGCWRMMIHFIEVYGMDIPDNPEVFYHAGRSFGEFIKCMADFPVEKIKTVIPNFHHTYSRYLDLEEAIKNNTANRLDDVWDEVNFIRARKEKFRIISDALESGEIPTRICHNDCNLNNILFSKKTHLPVAIIDLDTVMPSSPLYDYGDSMRIGTNTARDDEKDLSKVKCDLALYESYARGFLEACGDLLTKNELELLPFSSLIITAEDGIRFLADHLNGDVYYNIFYPEQNLDRARTQLKLLEDMEEKLPEIRAILKKIYMDLGLEADPFSRENR